MRCCDSDTAGLEVFDMLGKPFRLGLLHVAAWLDSMSVYSMLLKWNWPLQQL